MTSCELNDLYRLREFLQTLQITSGQVFFALITKTNWRVIVVIDLVSVLSTVSKVKEVAAFKTFKKLLRVFGCFYNKTIPWINMFTKIVNTGEIAKMVEVSHENINYNYLSVRGIDVFWIASETNFL